MGLTAPLFAGRRLQAASDSNAALRQQAQIVYIASSDPRLVEKTVVRSSWLVKIDIIPEQAVVESHSGPHKAPFIGELAAKGGLRG